jgi:hypothetical protein
MCIGKIVLTDPDWRSDACTLTNSSTSITILVLTDEDMTPTMLAARRVARTLALSRGFDAERLLPLVRRLVQEPKAQDLGLGIAADTSERIVSRLIRTIFQVPEPV